jgi:hypothetical protein
MVLSHHASAQLATLLLGCVGMTLLRFRSYTTEFSFLSVKPVTIQKKEFLARSPLLNMYTDTLYPGELPGYTGWARPKTTLAGSFRVTQYQPTAAPNAPWVVQVHCNHAECHSGGSLFYVRAYGPAVLTGTVQDHQNGTYTVEFYPMDVGSYTVEVVLAFSSHPAWNMFPLDQEPVYEGYLLPQFPLEMVVASQDSQTSVTRHTQLPMCNMAQLFETSVDGALQKGRWVVEEKNIQGMYQKNNKSVEAVLEDYKAGESSIGVHMKYVPDTCTLLTARAARDAGTLQSCIEQGSMRKKPNSTKTDTKRRQRRPFVLFIGDSNFRLQQEMFERFFGQTLDSTRISTEGGILVKLPEIRKRLDELAADNKKSKSRDYYVIFNTGLHDLDKMCQKSWRKHRAPLIGNVSDADFFCQAAYKESLTEFVQVVDNFPARLKVWQSTTAGWPKWGNFGISWPADHFQHLPADPTAIMDWNQVAWDVLQPYKNRILVQDAYWLTLSRPDHRESNRVNALGPHLVHAGPQVYFVLLQKLAMAVLQTICPSNW